MVNHRKSVVYLRSHTPFHEEEFYNIFVLILPKRSETDFNVEPLVSNETLGLTESIANIDYGINPANTAK